MKKLLMSINTKMAKTVITISTTLVIAFISIFNLLPYAFALSFSQSSDISYRAEQIVGAKGNGTIGMVGESNSSANTLKFTNVSMKKADDTNICGVIADNNARHVENKAISNTNLLGNKSINTKRTEQIDANRGSDNDESNSNDKNIIGGLMGKASHPAFGLTKENWGIVGLTLLGGLAVLSIIIFIWKRYKDKDDTENIDTSH